MSTRSGTGPPGFDGYASVGSYTDPNRRWATTRRSRAAAAMSCRSAACRPRAGSIRPTSARRTTMPAAPTSLLDVALPAGGNNFTNLTFVHSFDTFQIPNDVAHGEPATTDDNETQDDTFLAFSSVTRMGDAGPLRLARRSRRPISRISGTRPTTGFTARLSTRPAAVRKRRRGYRLCGRSLAPGNPCPTTVRFSLSDTRTEIDYIVQSDYFTSSGRTRLRPASRTI